LCCAQLRRKRMKRIFVFIVGGLLLLSFVSSACAWEFTMKGEFEYRYRYFSRTGPKDLYGNLAFQDTGASPNAIGFAGPAWYGPGAGRPLADANALYATSGIDNFITRGGFSRYSSDARITDMKMTLYPSIRVNPAIEIFLALNIGGFRNKYAMFSNDAAEMIGFDSFGRGTAGSLNYSSGVPPLERYYMSQTSDAATNTASLISVDEFKFAVQVPMGFLSFGTKNFPLGTGATFARNTREESIYFAVPYGPFLLRTYLFPSEPPRTSEAGGSATTGRADFVSSSGQEATPIAGWGSRADGELVSRRYLGGVVQYLAGELEVGLGVFNRKQHIPRGYITNFVALVVPVAGFQNVFEDARYTFDRESWLPIAWFKYNNGRFFFNAEGALLAAETNISNYQQSTTNTDGPQSITTTYYSQLSPKMNTLASHVFAEAGFFSGPSKLSLMYAQSSGRVLNAGFANFGGSSGFVPAYGQTYVNRWGIMPVNYQALEPYNILMFNIYGGGNNVVNSDGTGEMGDARAFACRLDYAVAANLNVFGSFMYAKRLERQGYYAGAFGTRDGLLRLGTNGNIFATGSNPLLDATAWKGANGLSDANPWINDDLIGWEADGGVAWKLLEGLTAEAKYGYWTVGPWFDMAYKAFNGSRVGGNNGNNVMFGRDAIQAITMSIRVDF
jgi:hypothetical protein